MTKLFREVSFPVNMIYTVKIETGTKCKGSATVEHIPSKHNQTSVTGSK